MGKLVKGLIAAAIPVAVIVGIASCGHRPVVMASAVSETWVYYDYNIAIPENYNERINNQIREELGQSITPIDVTGNNDSSWAVRKNSFAYLHHFQYGWSSLGNFQIVAHSMDWYVWDGSALSTTLYFRDLLDEYKDYFIYAYASSQTQAFEYGFPSIWNYTANTDTISSAPVATRSTSYVDFLQYTFPYGDSTQLKVNNGPLSNYLVRTVQQYAQQAEMPTYDNNGAYQQGREQGYQAGYVDGLSDGRTDGYDDGYWDGRNDGYREGQNSVTSESTAINNLFASLVSVPINVLNGLMPMAVWNTPIVGIMITFMLLAMLMWLIRKLLSR